MSQTLIRPGFIQVAGVIDQAEIDLLRACGVHFLGFPLRLPVNTEDLEEAEAARLIQSLSPPDFGVLITYQDSAEDIQDFCLRMNARVIQLHGPIAFQELDKLRQLMPDLTIIKSLVIGLDTVQKLHETISELAPLVDAFITDTYNPDTGASGATGLTHDWAISRKIVELSPKPVILAGGLNPDNVFDAVVAVKPAGVDVHTGVEDAEGRKSRELVTRFINQATSAFASF
ncbi:MAG: phosphoribosylanthranilate isomerase [bacterium]